MPIYKLQGPDGKIYKVEGPEGATAEQLGQFIMSQTQGRESKAAAQLEADRNLYDPTVGMSGTEKFLAGTGKAFADIGRGVSQYLPGGATREDIAASRAQDAPLMNTGAGMAGNIAGNVAAAVPTAFIPGANTITGAGLIGAGLGAIQPSTSTTETLKNIGVGAVSSAAMPVLVQGAQAARAALDPFSQAGQKRIIGRAMNTAAGNDSPAALQNLRNAAMLVPGSVPTAGQVAQNPGIAALERTAIATDPVAMNEMARRVAMQDEARIGAIQKIAGTPAARTAAIEARDDAAQVAYGRARQSDAMRRSLAAEQQANIDAQNFGLTLGSGLPQRGVKESTEAAIRPSAALEDLAKRPAFKGYIEEARRLAANKGQDIGNPMESVDGLHYIKLAIDDALSGANPTQALGRNAKSATMDMKSKLIEEMDKISPAYAVSREAYQQASRPINQMELAAQLLKPTSEGGALNPVRGNMTPAAYARLLKDDTAAKVTGFKGATLANTLEPPQLATLNAVKDDLARADFAQTAGRGVGSDTVQKMAYSNLMDKSGLPAWLTALPRSIGVGGILQRVGDVGYKSANQEMSAKLAQALLNPQEAAQLMEAGMVTPKMIALMNGLRRGGTALGATAPGLVQANQQ